MLFGPLKLALRLGALLVAAVVVYFAVTMVQVWLTSRQDDPHHADAVLVMGAAQYNGVPSPDLQSRLSEAKTLFDNGDATLIVVTGGKQPGDVYTEAEAGQRYLVSHGIPSGDILQAGGDDSYENIADAVPELRAHGATTVLVTTDGFHEDRSMAIVASFSLTPSPTPAQDSPITGWSSVPYFLKEGVGVALGRVIGFNHLEWLHDA